MRDPKEIRAEIDASQADLEQRVGELKQLFEDKLEGPREVVAKAEHAVAAVRTHWLIAAASATAVVGLAVGGMILAVRLIRRTHS